MNRLFGGLIALAALAAATTASAVTFSFTPGSDTVGSGYAPTTGYVVLNDFNTVGDLSVLSGTVGTVGIYGPGSNDDGAEPAFPSGDNSPYLSVLGGASTNINFAQPYGGAFQFNWGSVDDYNTLTIHRFGLSDLVISGSLFLPANGDRSSTFTNGVFNAAGNGEFITGITLASRTNSFEIDNFSAPGGSNPLTGGAVPEPATWAMMIFGFGMTGAMLRQRQRRAVLA
jgi:hypothetical protein